MSVNENKMKNIRQQANSVFFDKSYKKTILKLWCKLPQKFKNNSL